MSIRDLKLVKFPPSYLQIQGTVGNTDSEKNVQKLNKLTNLPDSFSFASHNTFITDDTLKQQIMTGEVDPNREVEELDLEDKMHDGIFTGAKRFTQTQVHSCQLCGSQAHTPAFFLYSELLWNSTRKVPTKHRWFHGKSTVGKV